MTLGACSLWPFYPAPPPIANLPATWSGDVTCPGCVPHQQALTLFADGSFHLRDEYPASKRRRGSEVFFDVGRWSRLSGDESRLILRGGSEAVRQFRLQADGHLRQLDPSGSDIRSIRDYVLNRETGLDPIAGPMRLLGQLSIHADAVRFQECLTGRDMQVIEALPVSVSKQYRVAQKLLDADAETPVLTSVLGSFSARLASANESAAGPVWQLDIQRVKRFWPGETCAIGAGAASLPLRDTPWRVLAIGNEPIPADPLAPPLALRLHDDGHVSGHSGCNTLRSAYRADDNALSFDAVSTTRRACIGPSQQALERAWLQVLQQTAAYRVVGSYLELLAGDRVLARLIANEMH
ncbi:heat shock protein HslJ [Paraperlucidibaca baekdonensis]|uniref:Heat shock protein HslJ n=2 Tax=Paraperlucidibaca baekdonensis TaxID=748120 RepID=A0A3E0H9U9_9GAMM|nr:heat shock protein HslJ [Paraperlucidibaca baekdonensis]